MIITSLKELLRHLEYGEGYNGYRDLFKDLEIHRSEVESLIAFNDENYTRNLIERTGTYELLLMCWKAGQTSPIHGYSGQQGWVYIVDGELSVDYFMERDSDQKMDHFRTETFRKGDFAYLNDYIGFHSVKNTGNTDALSLHLHAGPVLEWKIYDTESGSYTTKVFREEEE